MAVDMNGFGDPRRTAEDQAYLRRSLYGLLAGAFEGAGVPWDAVVHEDRGDGVLVVAPSTIPTGLFVDEVFTGLGILLRRHNRWSSDLVKIKLRMALHAGHVHFDEHGMAGHALVHLFRLLEAPGFKSVFGASAAELGLSVSGYLYDEVVRDGRGGIEPDAFVPLPVQHKETSAGSWVHMRPGPVVDVSFTEVGVTARENVARRQSRTA
ncbi:hypothetical protein ACQP1W_12245 [Spirillospora sp. CA-255316]